MRRGFILLPSSLFKGEHTGLQRFNSTNLIPCRYAVACIEVSIVYASNTYIIHNRDYKTI